MAFSESRLFSLWASENVKYALSRKWFILTLSIWKRQTWHFFKSRLFSIWASENVIYVISRKSFILTLSIWKHQIWHFQKVVYSHFEHLKTLYMSFPESRLFSLWASENVKKCISRKSFILTLSIWKRQKVHFQKVIYSHFEHHKTSYIVFPKSRLFSLWAS